MSYGFETYVDRQLSQLTSGINLSGPSPNQSVFRYIGLNTKTSWEYLEQTLNDFKLRGAPASSLNDPFEVSPCVFDDLRPAVVEAIVKRPNFLQDKNTSLNHRQVSQYKLEAKNYMAQEKKTKRTISFCERSESPLLWSHYSNSYRGASLHFIGGKILSPAFISSAKIGRVIYSDHRPIYPLSLALTLQWHSQTNQAKNADLLKAESDQLMFFSKATDWAYEKELRIVYDGGKTSDMLFNPDSLVSIIIGPKMPEENIKKLEELVKSSKMPHLQLRRAIISDSSFNVHIDWNEG